MRNEVRILDIPFNSVNMKEAVERAKRFAVGDRFRYIFTPNPEIVMISRKDEELKKALLSADMLVPDGIGIVIASGFYGERLPERVAGFDLTTELIEVAAQRGWSFFFLGGKPGINEKARKRLEKKYPNIRIVGYHHGYFNEDEEEEIITHINLCNPNILLVGMGAPRQEKWIFKNRKKLKANLAIGVGGTLNIFAGAAIRAPKIFRMLGLEWFFRLILEPWRIKRMSLLPMFLVRAFLEAKLGKLFKKK